MEKSLKKGDPVAGSNWDPSQEEAPRLDTVTEAVVCLQTGA
ncbi:mCG141106, isoform CRA_a [Mus musculus]|nr:mCG141106, isoform CRA_a [Mus musculus]EDL00509.1 mCG141106, isoform CRA_a [Mus musculus]